MHLNKQGSVNNVPRNVSHTQNLASVPQMNVKPSIPLPSKQTSPKVTQASRSLNLLSKALGSSKVSDSKTNLSQKMHLGALNSTTNKSHLLSLFKPQAQSHTLKTVNGKFQSKQPILPVQNSYVLRPATSSEQLRRDDKAETATIAANQTTGANTSRRRTQLSHATSTQSTNMIKKSPFQSSAMPSTSQNGFIARRLSAEISKFNNQNAVESRRMPHNMGAYKRRHDYTSKRGLQRISFNSRQSSSLNKTNQTNPPKKALPKRIGSFNQPVQNTLSFKLNLNKIGLGKNFLNNKNGAVNNQPQTTKNWPTTEPETSRDTSSKLNIATLNNASETTSVQNGKNREPTILSTDNRNGHKPYLSTTMAPYSERVSPYRSFDCRKGSFQQLQRPTAERSEVQMSSPNLDKPMFAQLSQRQVNETLLTSNHETSSFEEADVLSCRKMSPPLGASSIQKDVTQATTNNFGLKKLLSCAGKKFTPGASVVSSPDMKRELSQNHSKKQSWQKGCFYQYCCLVPNQTKSSEQIKFSTQGIQFSQNASAANFNSIQSKHQNKHSKHSQKLGTSKSGAQLIADHVLKDLKKIVKENNNYAKDEKSMIVFDKTDIQAGWDLLSSSGGDSMISREVCDDVPDETSDKKTRLSLNKQPSVHTMTHQNLRLSSATKNSNYHGGQDLAKLKHSPVPQGNNGVVGGGGPTSMSDAPQFSLLRNGQCTQSFTDIMAERSKIIRPVTQLDDQKHQSSQAKNNQNNPGPQYLKINIDQTEPQPPCFLSNDKKNHAMFSTPKPVANSINKSLLPYGEIKAIHPMFKGKPSLPTTASMPIFQSDNDDATQYTLNQNTYNLQPSLEEHQQCKRQLNKESTQNFGAISDTQQTSNHKSDSRRPPLSCSKSAAQTKPQVSPSAFRSKVMLPYYMQLAEKSTEKLSRSARKTNLKDFRQLEDIAKSNNNGDLMDLNHPAPTSTLFPSAANQDCDTKPESTFTGLQLTWTDLTETFAQQASKRNVEQRQVVDFNGVDVQVQECYRVIGAQKMPKQERARTIDAFLQRQNRQESERQLSIKSMTEKIFIAETKSDVKSQVKQQRQGSRSSEKHSILRRPKLQIEASSDGNCSDQPRQITFLKRMANDVTKRRSLQRQMSPNFSKRVTARGEICLQSPPIPKDPQNTPQCTNDSCMFGSSGLKGFPKSARSNISQTRLLQPTGNFSSSMKKQALVAMPSSKSIKVFNNGLQRSQDSHSERELSFGRQKIPSVSATLQLSQIQGSFLAQACQQFKPGKELNDKIVLQKLEEELKPLQTKVQQSIVALERKHFREMLFDLHMLQRPTPSKRDEQDAQEFLDILFPVEETTLDTEQNKVDISSIQRQNDERMITFIALDKALLLHKTDPTSQLKVQDAQRRDLLTKINEDEDYQDWLADRFFIFYLNRTRSYKQTNRENDDPAEQILKLRLQKLSSLSSMYMAELTQNSKDDQNPSDILERPVNMLQATDTDDKTLQLPKTTLSLQLESTKQQRRTKQHRQLKIVHVNGQKQQAERKVRSLKRQKEHAQQLISFGLQRQQERERLRLCQDEKEIQTVQQHENDKKAKLAIYPWIEDEMVERKADCCQRLHIDALRRLGLPLPEFDQEPVALDLLDAKFDLPSIYQAIQQGDHAPLAAFQTTRASYESRLLQECFMRYSNLKVPKDDLTGTEQEYLDDDIELFGNLPVLSVDLVDLRADSPSIFTERLDYPSIMLYEDDLVVEKVQQYAETWPLPDLTKVNLVEHIAFKIDQLHTLSQ